LENAQSSYGHSLLESKRNKIRIKIRVKNKNKGFKGEKGDKRSVTG